MKKTYTNELEILGIIHIFSYNFNLAIKTIEAFYRYQCAVVIDGPDEIIRYAFNGGIIADGHIWMDMLKKSSLVLSSYDEAIRSDLFKSIVEDYFPALTSLQSQMNERVSYV